MNSWEKAYEQVLLARLAAGEISAMWHEAITLKIAFDTRYTADFVVMLPDGSLELHEVKGYMREDALIKLRVVAANFPFRLLVARYLPSSKSFRIDEVKSS